MSQHEFSIWDNVKELLHLHDCVIVPGFGGFVCNKESSKIDQVTHVITPPSRKVIFNQNLKTNDGLLAGYIAKNKQISYTQAISIIELAVAQTLEILQDKKILSIDLFGNFRLNTDANYVFLPDKRNNYLTSSFGLGLIQAQPVLNRTVKLNKTRNFSERKKIKTVKPNKNVWSGVLAVSIVLLLSVNGFIFLNRYEVTDVPHTMDISSWFDSLLHSEKYQPSLPEAKLPLITEPILDSNLAAPEAAIIDTEAITSKVDLAIYAPYYAFATHYQAARSTIYFPQPPIAPVDSVIIAPSIDAIPSVLNTEGVETGFYVIGGVFCKERNAKRFITQLNESGYDQAAILVNASLNCKRVSYQKFDSREDAESFCSQIKSSSNANAWVLEAQ